MSFHRADRLYPHPEEIFGTPEELEQDAKLIPMQQRLRVLLAMCLRCRTITDVGFFQFLNDHVTLPNGDSLTAEDWKWEALKAHNSTRGAKGVSKAFQRSWHCPHCDQYTWFIAEGIK